VTAVLLSRLRVMPPVGSPVTWPRSNGERRVGLYVSRETAITPDGWIRMTELADSERDTLALDLSAPTTDRLDGADVAARMLAQHAGLDVSRGVCWETSRGSAHVSVYVHACDSNGYPAAAQFPRWPAVFESDATDPRDILAAVLVAALGTP